MSTKGDLATNTDSSPFHKPSVNDASTQKSNVVSSKKTNNSSSPLLPSKSNSLPNKATTNTNSAQPRPNSPTITTLNFASRFLTKSPLRALTIDTTNEGSSYNVLDSNRLTSFSATHNPADQHVHTRNSLVSSLNGNLSAKYSRAVETYRRPAQISPSKGAIDSKSLISSKALASSNFPFSATNQSSGKALSNLGSDFAKSLLNSLTPTGLHCKKLTTKSYSQDRYKGTLFTSFDNKRAHVDHLRKICTTSALDSSRSFQASDISQNQDQSGDISLSTIFKSFKGSFGSSLQSPKAKKALTPIPNHEPTKCSVTRNGIVKAYAANTNQGIVRNYNEDRVSIILNIMKPASRANEEWPKCSFFGVYDGHGGVGCADFLRDNLHQYVIKEPSFPSNPKEALMRGFEAAEKTFLSLADGDTNKDVDRSGSCALVVLIVGEMCYVANVGDSRAVMSGEGGTKIYPLSKDHKPEEDSEYKRITEAGGKVYQSQAPISKQASTPSNQAQIVLGPHRVLPGRLSVSRTFGDIEAKLQKFGGNPNVVIATPVIKTFRVSADHDFIVLGTDGIYDKLSSRDAIKSVWETTHEVAPNIHHQCGLGVENILREAINRRTLDNITVVMISFKNFKQKLFPDEKSQRSDVQETTQTAPDVISSSMVKSALLSSSTVGSSPKVQTKKPNLQEKLNIDEKANITAGKLTLDRRFFHQNSLGSSLTSRVTSTKKPSNTPRENNFFLDLPFRKENKESLPISDVNLPNMKLSVKRETGSQKIVSTNRPTTNQQEHQTVELVKEGLPKS